MNKNFFFTAVLVIALAFGMTACPTDGGMADTWTDITSLTQLNGTWKGTFTLTGDTIWTNVTVKAVEEHTYSFSASNANTGTGSSYGNGTATYYGSGLASNWDSIKTYIASQGGNIITCNDTTHTITYSATRVLVISLSDINGWQINQNGTKFRRPYSPNDSNVAIFTKQ